MPIHKRVHVAISCGVLVISPSGALLLGHASGARHWDIFKGIMDPGETPIDTALRELQEESGLTRQPGDLLELGRFDYLPRKNLHLFAMSLEEVPTSTFACTSMFVHRSGRSLPEIDAYMWTRFADIPQRCGKSMTQVLSVRLSLAEVMVQLGGR